MSQCLSRVAVFLPLTTSQSLIVPSLLPEARALPSGLNATHRTRLWCPVNVAVFLPLATSHNLISLSISSSLGKPGRGVPDPEARVLPSRLNATELTQPLCPRRVAVILP